MFQTTFEQPENDMQHPQDQCYNYKTPNMIDQQQIFQRIKAVENGCTLSQKQAWIIFKKLQKV